MYLRCIISGLFGSYIGVDWICVCHRRFTVGFFEQFFFLSFDVHIVVKIAVKIVVKIVVIVTVSFQNFFLPFNYFSFCCHDSLYACLGIHTLLLHCLMVMFATKNVLWIPMSKSFSNPCVWRVQNVIYGRWYYLPVLWRQLWCSWRYSSPNTILSTFMRIMIPVIIIQFVHRTNLLMTVVVQQVKQNLMVLCVLPVQYQLFV